jgi:hypothetical protein
VKAVLTTLAWTLAVIAAFVFLWMVRIYVFTSGFEAFDSLGR